MKYARAKRAKILFSIFKYANLWGLCCRRRRGCLKLSIKTTQLGLVSDKSRNFSGLFRVSQFPLYRVRNTEVLSLQTSQSSWFLLH